MGRFAWSQLRFRPARALALIAGVLVAATAFTGTSASGGGNCWPPSAWPDASTHCHHACPAANGQRIAIARALINTPALLLADEPAGNLDSVIATEILDLLARLRAEHHMTMVLASHDPQIAARADRLIRLRDGAVIDDIQLTQDRPAQDIIRHVSQLG
jgi:hypothetical protein